MTLKISVKVEGAAEVNSAIAKLIQGIPRGSKKAIVESLAAGGKISDSKVPVKTGRLKSSKIERTTGDFQGEFSYNVEYAKYVEYGTIRMLARPYFTPGIQQIQTQLPTLMRSNIGAVTGL